MKALLVIDYTVDFVDGKLPVGEPAIEIEEGIVQLTQQFIDNGDLVVMSVDVHEEEDPYHPESKLFPPHNINGTDGRDLFGRLKPLYEANKDRIVWMDKTRYSAFCGTRLELLLRERGITELHLAGVCTDICILHTAIEAYNKGYDIKVHESGVASFNADGHQFALSHFEQVLGAEVIRLG